MADLQTDKRGLKGEHAPNKRASADHLRTIRNAADALDAGARPGYVLAFEGDPEPRHPLKGMRRANAPGAIYFIGGKRGGPVKIGFSTDVRKRLVKLQAGSPTKLEVLALWEGRDKADEKMLHRRFYRARLHGEWFERTPELMAEIERLTPNTFAQYPSRA